VHKSGDGQLQVGLGGKGEGVVHLGTAKRFREFTTCLFPAM
jgi:hypothetical protein